ncbi:tRNA modification GTPase MnmE [Candidatus Hepatincola sp. Pdp]
MPNKTIYALSTPFVKSAIAIIRVSGSNAKFSLENLCPKANFLHGKAVVTDLLDSQGNMLDNAMVLFFEKGHSYTGEDLVEYHVHGSIAVIKDVLAELSRINGYRMAEAGEFTKRALENGKLNLQQVEGIVDLIEARTSKQREQSLKELKGETYKSYLFWYESIKEILAFCEATLDFSDQELDDNLLTSLKDRLLNIHQDMEAELAKSSNIQKLKTGISLAILGIPNVGKSSLINSLANQEVAIVSEIAGTTRDIIETFLDIQGFPVSIADTAGIRATTNKIELIGVNKALAKAKSTDLKIIMFSAEDFQNSYVAMENMIDDDSLLIVNKIDLNTKLQLPPKHKFHLISVKTKAGIQELQQILAEKLAELTLITENPIITQQRHIELITGTKEELQQAITNFDDPIIVAHHLHSALVYLGKIFGKVDIEEILGLIFSNMCIGK